MANLPAKKCLLLNSYTRTLKVLTMPQTLDNWCAVIGTNQVEQFYLRDGQGTACIYSDDIPKTDLFYGTQFTEWYQPIIGMLLFMGPPDQEGDITSITDIAISLLKADFKKAKIGSFVLLNK